MAQPAEKQSAVDAILAQLDAGKQPWAQAAREDAIARVKSMGMPDRRDEYWKFTRPDSLTQPVAEPAALFDPQEAPVFEGLDRLQIVFVDGVFDADASDDLHMEGITIERLQEARSDLHWARELYGVLETHHT